jgi:uroporphyrinogen decarboxylase
LEAEAYGSETVFIEQYAPNVKQPIINNLSEIGTIKIPDIYKSPSIQFFLQSTRLLANAYKKNKAIAAVLHSPCDLPSLLMGIEMWIDTLLFHPHAVEEVLEKTTEHFINLGNEFIAQGATFLVVPVNFTNPMIITNKIFSKLLPHLENAFSQIKGPIVIHNGGCVLKPFLAQFSKLPNVIAVVPDSSEKLDEAREIVGEKMVLMGNFDGPDFINLSPNKAKEVCLKILDNRKHDKHYIFATSNADIPYNTPVETIKAVVDAIKNYQKY